MLKNGLYNVAGAAIKTGVGIITIPMLIRLLGIQEYGVLTLTSTVIGLVTLAEAGLSMTTTVLVSQDLAKQDVKGLSETLTVTLTSIIILATLAAVALFLIVPSIVSYFPKFEAHQHTTVIQALQVAAYLVWARLIQQVLVGIEQAYQKYGWINLLNTTQSILLSIGLLLVAVSGGRTVSLMQWQALVSIVGLWAHFSIVKTLLTRTQIRPTWSREKALIVWRHSLMMWLTTLGSSIFGQADRLVVGYLLGSQQLGIYAAITDITVQINSFSAFAVQPLLPKLSQFTSQECQKLKLHEEIKQAMQINILVALGLGTVLIAFCQIIFKVILPQQTPQQYIHIFCIAVIIYSLYSVNAVGYYILLARNQIQTCIFIQLVSSILSIILITIGASSNIGLLGVVLGNCAYLGIYLQTYLGMRSVSISNLVWIKWLLFPYFVFILSVIIYWFIPVNMNELRIIILGISLTSNLLWIIHNHKKKCDFSCQN